MVSYIAKLDHRTKQHTQFGVSASNGSRDMARTKVAEKKKEKKEKRKKRKKNEHGQNYIASPTGIANDQLYFESQVYRVYDSYHVVICHHCQKVGHMASKCPDKNDGNPPICGKCASTHETQKCNAIEKKCVNCVRRGITVNTDHGTYDKIVRYTKWKKR